MKLISVYLANGEAEAYIIKGILEENGIPSVLSYDVSVGLIASGLGVVRVMVDEAKAAEARELVREQNNV